MILLACYYPACNKRKRLPKEYMKRRNTCILRDSANRQFGLQPPANLPFNWLAIFGDLPDFNLPNSPVLVFQQSFPTAYLSLPLRTLSGFDLAILDLGLDPGDYARLLPPSHR
ncbi:MAG TPA: hypothetical protein VKL99_03515 [Candidatus Angelobacter sp.]|nr:hypothetical protein [Candidatus Angelobacter sp.]